MASVLVLLFALFCGVYTASLPDALDSTLDSAQDGKMDSTLDSAQDSNLDSTLDGLDPKTSDNIKQTVLEGVKKLLDSQLAALVKDKDRNRDDHKRTFKPWIRSRLMSKPREEINQETSSSEDQQNSELVKSLTDNFQDPGDDAITNAVDELLKENKDLILEDKDEIILDNNVDNMLDLENSTNNDNGGIISQDGYDEIASQLYKYNKKDRKGNKSHNRKQGNRVVIDRLPKIKEKDDDRYKYEDKLEEKLNGYDENMKTQRNSDDEPLESRKKSIHKKERKNQIEVNENGSNLDEYINTLKQLIKKQTNSEVNKKQNLNLVYPIYQRGQKYGRHLYDRSKTLPNKYRSNGNRHKYYKLAKKLQPKTVTSNTDTHKPRYNDVNEENLKQKSLQNELTKFTVVQGKHETNQTNDAAMSKDNAHEETNKFTENKYEVRGKLGQEKDSGNEVKNSVTEKNKNITADNIEDAKMKDYLTSKLRKANQIESDESVNEKRILQEIEDNAITDTKDHANDVADKEDNTTENEEDITETENIYSEKENVAGETKAEEGDKDYILDFLENTQNTDTIKNKNATKDKLTKKEDINVSKKDIARNCHHGKYHESDEFRILRDLIQNNDIKKSFSFSLNFTS